jgi:hypothetical protein
MMCGCLLMRPRKKMNRTLERLWNVVGINATNTFSRLLDGRLVYAARSGVHTLTVCPTVTHLCWALWDQVFDPEKNYGQYTIA